LEPGFVGGIEPDQVATGLDEFVFGAGFKRPVTLDIPHVGCGGFHGSLQFEKTCTGEAFDRGRNQKPREQNDAQGDKGLGLIKTLGRHGGGIYVLRMGAAGAIKGES